MTKIVFATAVHERPLGRGGEIVRLDWESQTVEASLRIDPEPAVPGGRDRTHGGGYRGLRQLGDEVVVASYDALLFLGPDLRPRRRISNSLMVDIHEIHVASPDRVLLTCPPIDSVLECDADSGDVVRAYWPREMSGLRDRWHLVPLALDKGEDHRARPSRGAAPRSDRLLRRIADRVPRRWWPSRYARGRSDDAHVNAVACWRGHVVALLASLGAIVDLDASEVLIEDPRLRGGHNLALLGDGRTIVANDTAGASLRFYDLVTRRRTQVIDLRRESWIRELERRALAKAGRRRELALRVEATWNPFVAPLQLRGLATDERHVWVGMSPAAIARFEIAGGRLTDGFVHSDDLRHRVNGLAAA